ncbi:MBL fold metallo-hydrolase [Dysosmobacter sp.]
MIRAVFLAHSGFLVELPSVTLLFDWWKGDLPPLRPGVPLLVFASHRHEDHFRPDIFALDDGSRPVWFLLGKDIRLTARNRARWQLSSQTAEKCLCLAGGQQAEPLPGIRVETLPSTDEGVAFLVAADEKTIYHAGDLNWWHWEGEEPAWNRDMEVRFQRYLEPLRRRHIDLAMVPLDPRLGDACGWGLAYFLDLTQTRRVLPMHQWEDVSPTERFCRDHPALAPCVVPIAKNGETFIFEEAE